jgi:hypothetical protein
LNGDGVLDLASANLTGSNVSELFGTGTGSFQSAVNLAVDAQPIAIVAADFSGDGKCDLAVSENNNGVGLALNDGSGAPNDFRLYAAGAPAGLVAGDFKFGSGLDLAVVSGGEGGYVGSVSLLLNTGRR